MQALNKKKKNEGKVFIERVHDVEKVETVRGKKKIEGKEIKKLNYKEKLRKI